jgi:4-hydroxy 2-oxovalerate aldolase
MGRGAGNLCTELITKFINDNIGKKYDLLAIMEVIDQHINPLFQTYSWGYSVPYYVAAIDKCHPNYAMYLVDKHSLGVNAIHNILVNLPEDKKRNYDEYVIQKLYITYQDNEVDDFKELKILKTKLQGREVLLLAPGRSIEDKEGKVKEFIHKEKPIIISINFLPEEIDTDFLFIGNKKRYDELELKGGFFDVPQIVVTSNVVKIMPYKGMVINYNGLINANYREVDISGAMAIRLLKKMDITQVYLAGFDGFSVDDRESFCNEKLYHKIDSEANELRNSSFEEQLQDLSKQIDLRFITPTRYRII